MFAIRPIAIDDTILTDSNVPDVDDVGTSATSLLIEIAAKTFTTQAGLPFAALDWVKAYSTATPANYMYGKVTSYSGTTLIVDMSVNGGAGSPADWKISYGWDVGASYLEGEQTQISATHKIYQALENVSGGDSPEVDVDADTPKWLEVSATNRWKAFDTQTGTQTSQAESITFEITLGSVYDSIAFLNVAASTVQVVVTDPTDGEVYNETTNLIAWDNITDWYTYFFLAEESYKITDFVISDVPPYLSAVTDITISLPSGTAEVGNIIFGNKSTIGNTQKEPSFGVTDYSTKEADAFGNWTIVERTFSKWMNCRVVVVNSYVDYIERFLALYRATSLVWVADEDFSSMIVYGFCRDHKAIAGDNITFLSLEIEGLT